MRLRETVDEAARRLAAAGVPSARHDAEALAAHVLGVDRRDLWRHDEIAPRAQHSYDALVVRRERREPLQHLTGVAYFRHLTLAVGPGVFVPRPETELVAGAAIDESRRIASTGGTPVVVDLGTGSGAIARSVADEVPAAVVHAVELAEDALIWARRNLEGSRVQLHTGDLAAGVPELDGTVDVVVSNPPYIPLDGVPRDPEVRDHDPVTSLYAGVDGLDVIRIVGESRCPAAAPRRFRRGRARGRAGDVGARRLRRRPAGQTLPTTTISRVGHDSSQRAGRRGEMTTRSPA